MAGALVYTGFSPFGKNPQAAPVVILMVRGSGVDPRLGFSPENVTLVIGVNNTVVWKNEDSTWHTAHSNIPEFDSRIVDPGQSFTYQFNRPGKYPYHCDPHPWMTGIITVKPSTSINSSINALEPAPVNAFAILPISISCCEKQQ